MLSTITEPSPATSPAGSAVASSSAASGWLAGCLLSLARWWMRRVWRVQTEGWGRLPAEGGALLVANHLSYTDAILIAASSPRPVRMLGTTRLCRHRWARWIYRLFHVIPVRPEDALSVVRASTAALRHGEVLVIFPEGRISVSGRLLPLQKGCLTVARRAGVPVLPVRLRYRDRIAFPAVYRCLWPSNSRLRNPSRARLRVGLPLDPTSLTMDQVRDALIDAGYEAFNQRPELKEHLAVRAVRELKRHPFHRQVVDRSTGRRELRSGMLLAVALTLAEHWRGRLPEKRVGVVFPSGLGGILTNLALTLLGKSAVNLNFTASAEALRKSMATAGIRTVITAAPVRQKLPDFPWPEDTVDLLEVRQNLSKATILRNYAQVLALPEKLLLKAFQVPTVGGDAEATVLFSSGSTGDPKGVVLTHANIIANCLQIEQCQLLQRDKTMLACLPIFHSFGYTVTLWYPLMTGLKIVCLPSPLETKRLAEAIRDEQVQVMMGTPTFLRPYFKRVPQEWLSSLLYVVAGAEKTPEGFHQQWEETFGSQYLEGYGLTETAPVLCANLPFDTDGVPNKRVGSVGRLFPGIKGRIIDPTSGRQARTGELGILEVQGANVFHGYLDDAYATHACFRDGWFVTQDLARFDEDGFLYIEGRISRFSKIGGEMVPHGTVENEIVRAFELDQEERPLVAIAGVSDARKGEALVLLSTVELKLEEVRERLMAIGVPNLWIPRKLHRVAEIPCLASGKLDLRAVAELAKGAPV